MNRFMLLMVTTFLVAVMVLSSGISVTYAQQDPMPAKPAVENDPVAAQRKADAAARALAKRAEMLKQRKAAREFIKKVVEGQQPGAAAPAPDNAGTGGAK